MTQSKPKVKKKFEYYILAGIKGMKEKLVEAELELSPAYLLIVKENSEIGKLIKKETKKQLERIKWKNNK